MSKTSANFHLSGKTDVAKEQLMMLVIGPRTKGRQFFKTFILTLSGPGDLLEGMDIMIRLTSVQETGDSWNFSCDMCSHSVAGVELEIVTSRLLLKAISAAAFAVFHQQRQKIG